MIMKEQDIVLTTTDADGNKVIQMPVTRIENVEGGVASINGEVPDESGNVKIEKVSQADSATKAMQDGNGNNIAQTYVPRSEAATLVGPQGPQGEPGIPGNQGERGEVGPHYTPSVDADGNLSWHNNGALENPETVNIKGPQGEPAPVDDLIVRAGARGTLAGYNTPMTTSAAISINSDSNDDTIVDAAVAVTIANSIAGRTWVKTVTIKNASATVTLGTSWKWANGEAPTITADSILVLMWAGSFGLANLVKGEA